MWLYPNDSYGRGVVMPKRARRRHDRWRAVQRARWVHKHIYRTYRHYPLGWTHVVPPDPRLPEKQADNMQLCSGWCCGNQRRHRGPTWRERRFE